MGSVAGVHVQLVGSSDGHGTPQDQPSEPGGTDFYAALLVLAIGAAFALLRVALKVRCSFTGSTGPGPLAGAALLYRFVRALEPPKSEEPGGRPGKR